ncbi:subtilisin-like serine protease [Phlyctochytrium bullatum]|nr:subtilisin-like serine protease [Phlyctochytrium bullatum]
MATTTHRSESLFPIITIFRTLLLLLALTHLSSATLIPNRYTVLFRAAVPAARIRAHDVWLARAGTVQRRQENFDTAAFPAIPAALGGAAVVRRFGGAETGVKGYAATMSEGLATLIKTLPDVLLVEQDRVVRINAKKTTTTTKLTPTTPTVPKSTQTSGAPWGLRRISDADLPSPGAYAYPSAGGAGVRVYVIDTGINTDHPSFAGRAFFSANFIDGRTDDDNGHGTHVAATAVSTPYGVAKLATVHSVRVLAGDGSGDESGVIGGISHVVDAAVAMYPANATVPPLWGGAGVRPVVINMSLGGDASDALDAAIAQATALGVAVVVAAGNEATDACTRSPARAKEALTVGAADLRDTFADFSNYGACVDVTGPGVDVNSAWFGNGSFLLSGTSMASPHAAGAVALLLSLQSSPPPLTPVYPTVASLFTALLSRGSVNRLKQLPATTANLVLQIPFATGAERPVPSPPPPRPPSNGCVHSVCVVGGALTCKDECVLKVVAADPYCGEVAWDATCVREAIQLCGVTC